MRNIKKKNPERGAVLAEFAIVLPLLLTLLMGTIELGLLFYNKQVVTNSSREGARAGIASSSSVVAIQDVVQNYCNDRLITFGPAPAVSTTVDRVIPDPLNPFGVPVTVNVSYEYTFLVPGLLGFGADLTLSAETMMRMERRI